MADRTCSVPDCEARTHARGWCFKHYARWRRHGDPLTVKPTGPTTLPPLRRFWGKVKVNESGCWIWEGALDPGGYGTLTYDKVGYKAHRFAYEHIIGPIPDDLQLDHLCRVRACCRPSHLEPVTCAENVRRGEGHGSESHCPQGHPYAGDNLYEHTDRQGYTRRMCRTCNREKQRRFKERRRQAA